MAEDQHGATVSSAFPAPPPFYKSFTAQKLNSLAKHLEGAKGGLEQDEQQPFRPLSPIDGTIPSTTSVPLDLLDLVPPPPPAAGKYTLFGTEYAVQPISKVDPTPSPPTQADLSALLRQILLKFLRIVYILSIDPSMKYYGPAWEELEGLLKRLHEGFNAWRPHQAREQLIQMMENQIREVKGETERVKETAARSREVVEGLAQGNVVNAGPPEHESAENGTKGAPNGEASQQKAPKHLRDGQRDVWRSIERELGET